MAQGKLDVTVSEISIPFAEASLAVRVYTQSGVTVLTSPHPVVVLCHGFCGVQGFLLPDIARGFARDGWVAVTFDYRGFGESGGERGLITPRRQQEDILAVLRWVRFNPVLDEQRLALWGVGLGGGYVLAVAARLPWVRCVVTQMPMLEGESLVMGAIHEKARDAFLQTIRERALQRRISGGDLWVPMMRLLHDPASRQFVLNHREQFPDIAMRIPYSTLDALLDFRPLLFARDVRQPTLVVAAELDTLTPVPQVRRLYRTLGGKRRLCVVKGCGHYALYESPESSRVLNAQRNWLARHL